MLSSLHQNVCCIQKHSKVFQRISFISLKAVYCSNSLSQLAPFLRIECCMLHLGFQFFLQRVICYFFAFWDYTSIRWQFTEPPSLRIEPTDSTMFLSTRQSFCLLLSGFLHKNDKEWHAKFKCSSCIEQRDMVRRENNRCLRINESIQKNSVRYDTFLRKSAKCIR